VSFEAPPFNRLRVRATPGTAGLSVRAIAAITSDGCAALGRRAARRVTVWQHGWVRAWDRGYGTITIVHEVGDHDGCSWFEKIVLPYAVVQERTNPMLASLATPWSDRIVGMTQEGEFASWAHDEPDACDTRPLVLPRRAGPGWSGLDLDGPRAIEAMLAVRVLAGAGARGSAARSRGPVASSRRLPPDLAPLEPGQELELAWQRRCVHERVRPVLQVEGVSGRHAWLRPRFLPVTPVGGERLIRVPIDLLPPASGRLPGARLEVYRVAPHP
jgi:hypothetical protein